MRKKLPCDFPECDRDAYEHEADEGQCYFHYLLRQQEVLERDIPDKVIERAFYDEDYRSEDYK